MLSESDISKLVLSSQTLSPAPGDKESRSTESSPVQARHTRNVSIVLACSVIIMTKMNMYTVYVK